MTEPRMRLRQKGQQFPTQDLEAFLLAFGDNDYPLPETIRVLDEIITDYIIETCHEAASVAHHARRAKIKLDDFKFMLRRDTGKLGRVSEMLETDKELKRKRKAFDTDEGAVLAEKDASGAKAGEAGKEEGKGGKKDGEREREGGGDEGERRKKKKKRREGCAGGGGDDASTVRSA
ncbi:hypothetical protein P3342_009598 [Pyrenophora teres f. teres]|nr:hypothetical protein HRS9139_08774 [Pyrenophora teres f. teres]KAE8834761.1 hypothetical protein PTNB85_06094 [Pyrenophora teres f. teres]KAE8861047.1 hypothetical protein PTNB29_06142 [Pyrenophora teres f. teres]KAK1908747.1 hypothetical protein P3342_009598 [Pyrenophora teres f. teres]